MHKHLAMLLCAALTVLTMACEKRLGGGHAVTQQDLLHHRFVLVSFNGKDFSAKNRVPFIEFNKGMRVSGVVCNRFTGKGLLDGSVLTVEQMISTRRFCSDPDLNELENLLTWMLSGGMELRLYEQHLFLRQDGYELLYKLSSRSTDTRRILSDVEAGRRRQSAGAR